MRPVLRILVLASALWLVPASAHAAEAEKSPQFNFDSINKVISFVINWLLIIAPALIILSFVWAALLWTLAGHNKVMVERAKRQFIATCVVLAVIGGFFLIKTVILDFALGSFGASSSSGDY